MLEHPASSIQHLAPDSTVESLPGHGEEVRLHAQGYRFVAGVDEAGRGALAGPVVAAAVILPQDLKLPGLKDSKLLTPKQRETLFEAIRGKAVAFSIGLVSAETIDALNILQATLLAMAEAIASLHPSPDFLLIDGRIPLLSTLNSQLSTLGYRAIPHGDRLYPSIAAASIVAKVSRDRIMEGYDKDFPRYGFRRHKGYGTPEHFLALARYGPSPLHRKSFRGVG
ncbi:MAG: ribonuclease HII [Candidatus Methylomirabilales bacterium]